MGFTDFKNDVAAAALASPQPHVKNIKRGEGDDDFVFTYSHEALGSPVRMRANVTDIAAYPKSHCFFVYADIDDVSPEIETAISRLSSRTKGKTPHQIVSYVAKTVTAVLEDDLDNDQQQELDLDDDDDDDYFDDSDYEMGDYGYDSLSSLAPPAKAGRSVRKIFGRLSSDARHRLRNDLTAAIYAGFKVKVLGDERATSGSIFALSFRVAGLEIPADTLEAWDLKPTDYIVLLMRLYGGYPQIDGFLDQRGDLSQVQFRLGKSESPEPSITTAQLAFKECEQVSESDAKDTTPFQQSGSHENASSDDFVIMYLFSAINELFQKQFPVLVQLRRKRNMSWEQAQEFVCGHGATKADDESSQLGGIVEKSESEPATAKATAVPVLQLDSALDDVEHFSLPLVAMQFALKRLAHCTEFCMVCQGRVPGGYEAVKPYVCDRKLCLFQYVVLGLGRNIEHEIIKHPYVVDLLISFFAATIATLSYRNKTQYPPRALGIKAPRQGTATSPNNATAAWADFSLKQVRFESEDASLKKAFGVGQRFVLMEENPAQATPSIDVLTCAGFDKYVCQVSGIDQDNITYSIVGIILDRTISYDVNRDSTVIPPIVAGTEGWRKVHLWPFDTDLDDMEDQTQRNAAVMTVLNLIPSVLEMRSYLLEKPGRRLDKWTRMDPSTRTLLNWIVASNRSFIVQDDIVPGGSVSSALADSTKQRKIEGMGGPWMQFRFQQGSPYKEHQFDLALQSLRAENAARDCQTLFGWHGSAMGCWHNIIREGLDFSETKNGRAYGNGVYFSNDFMISHGYTRSTGLHHWENTVLRPNAAVSICEIVNKPDKFISTTPYLVVDKTEWIQCRYLLVQVSPTPEAQSLPLPNPVRLLRQGDVEQEEARMLRNGRTLISIPRIMPATVPPKASPKRGKENCRKDGNSESSIDEEDIGKSLGFCDVSSGSDTETSSASFSKRSRDSSEDSSMWSSTSKRQRMPSSCDNDGPPTPKDLAVTPFTPGLLDRASLPALPPPSWVASSPAASKRLIREIKDMQAMQSSTSAAELGWYIDFEKMDNMFQWIVELHSFADELPLAKDMRSEGCESIVLEMRFGSDYPMAPPFVRVIQPMFVPFRQGGGGHITEGGAICSELLTNSGWVPVLSLDKVLLAVRLGLCDEERPARLVKVTNGSNYSIGEAVTAYERAARSHGWKLPDGFRDILTM